MRLRVLDPSLLSRACRQIERWWGSQAKAAYRLDIGLGQFCRLRNQRGGHALNARVFRALWRHIPPDSASERDVRRWERDFLGAFAGSPTIRANLTSYARWLKRELRRFAPRFNPDGGWAGSTTAVRLPAAYAGALDDLRARHGSLFKALVTEADRLAPRILYKDGSWDRWGPAVSRWRVELAYIRIVEPLLTKTGGIELTTADLQSMGRTAERAYLRAAIRREVILLRRASDVQRAAGRSGPTQEGRHQ